LLSFVLYTWNDLSHRQPALVVLTFPAAYHNRNVIFFSLVYIALLWSIIFSLSSGAQPTVSKHQRKISTKYNNSERTTTRFNSRNSRTNQVIQYQNVKTFWVSPQQEMKAMAAVMIRNLRYAKLQSYHHHQHSVTGQMPFLSPNQ